MKLQDSSAYIEGEKADEIHSEAYYGKKKDGRLVLSPSEALHLAERGLVEESPGEIRGFYEERDSEFNARYAVYSDLRERGLIVKTGFKFGGHFRVYARGVNPYKEDKSRKEHTKYIVHAVRENSDMSFHELSRAVRLAGNIRAEMMWGVVDSEEEVTYYRVNHMNP